jgi:hypothetical protein
MYVFGGDYITLYNSLDSFFVKSARKCVFFGNGCGNTKKSYKD